MIKVCEDSKFLSIILQGGTYDWKEVPVAYMALRNLVTLRIGQVVNKQFILGHVKGHNVAAHRNILFGQSYIVRLLNLIIST